MIPCISCKEDGLHGLLTPEGLLCTRCAKLGKSLVPSGQNPLGPLAILNRWLQKPLDTPIVIEINEELLSLPISQPTLLKGQYTVFHKGTRRTIYIQE